LAREIVRRGDHLTVAQKKRTMKGREKVRTERFKKLRVEMRKGKGRGRII